MNTELSKTQDMFLEKINQICREFGLNNIMAQLYAVLYFSDRPLSLNDMLERLRISKGSVSVNIRNLERYGAAKKVWMKGSRRDYYEAERDLSTLLMDRVKSMAKKRIDSISEMMNSARASLNTIQPQNAQDREEIETFKQRLERLRDLQARAESMFNLFNSTLLKTVLNIKTKKNSTQKTPLVSVDEKL